MQLYTCANAHMLLAGDHWLSTRDFNSDSDTYGGPQVDPHDN